MSGDPDGIRAEYKGITPFEDRGEMIVEFPVGDTTAFVDVEDWPRVCKYHWSPMSHPRGTCYATARIDSRKPIRLHRFVLGLTDPEVQVDHRDMNGMNCVKSNLRIATQSQNCANKTKMRLKGATSRYKGVSKSRNRWRAQIRINHKMIHIGIFATEEEAALAYNQKAKELFGEFARVNRVRRRKCDANFLPSACNAPANE